MKRKLWGKNARKTEVYSIWRNRWRKLFSLSYWLIIKFKKFHWMKIDSLTSHRRMQFLSVCPLIEDNKLANHRARNWFDICKNSPLELKAGSLQYSQNMSPVVTFHFHFVIFTSIIMIIGEIKIHEGNLDTIPLFNIDFPVAVTLTTGRWPAWTVNNTGFFVVRLYIGARG